MPCDNDIEIYALDGGNDYFHTEEIREVLEICSYVSFVQLLVNK